MRNRTKFLCLLLVICMVLPLFAACNKNGKPVHIVDDGKSDYTIIYSNAFSATADAAAAEKLRNAIEEKTGVKLKLDTDFIPESATQILVGSTSREATKDALATIREKDFIIAYRAGQVVIAGGTDDATARAVDYFIENYINEKKSRVTVYDGGDYVDEFDYMLGELSVDGTPLADYTIVYPADAPKLDKVTYYVAVNLYDFLSNNAGIKLKLATDAASEVANEILVGKTNRAASQRVANTALAGDEYLLYQDGTKIVMMGSSLMVGGAASAFVNDYFKPQGTNVAINATLPTEPTPEKFTFKKATSAILMIGDGMGANHILAGLAAGQANIAANSAANKCMDEFVAELLPYKAMCVTASQSVLDGTADFTDSAAAATALATGYKTLNHKVGQDKDGNSLKNIRELAHDTGARTAVLTTAAISDATPAGFLAHAGDRYDESIQEQIDALLSSGGVTYAKGDTNDLNKVRETELVDNAREALALISENNSKHFALIEEAHVDKFSHKVQEGKYATLNDVQNSVICYNETIAYVIGFVMLHPETALIVTADHECGSLTIDEQDGSFHFEFNSNDHTNVNVPIYGLGDVSALLGSAELIDNTDVPKFIATIFGESNFGAQ